MAKTIDQIAAQNTALLKSRGINFAPATADNIRSSSDNPLLDSLDKNPKYQASNVEAGDLKKQRAGLEQQKIKVTNLDGSVTERSLTDLMLNSGSTDWMQKALSIALPLANDPTKYKNVYVGGYTEKDANGNPSSEIKKGLFSADLNQAKELLKDTAAEQYLRTDTPQFDGFKIKDKEITATPYVRPVFGTDEEIQKAIKERKDREAGLAPNQSTWDKIGLNIISGENIKDPKNASTYNDLTQLQGAGIGGFLPFLNTVNNQPALVKATDYFNALKKDGQNISEVFNLENNGSVTYKNPKTFDEFKLNVENKIGKTVEGTITGAESLPNFARDVVKGNSDLSLEGYKESTARLERANQNMSTPDLIVNKVGGFALDTTGVVVTSIQATTDIMGSAISDIFKTRLLTGNLDTIDKEGKVQPRPDDIKSDFSFSDTKKAINNIPNYRPKDYSNPFRAFMDRPEQISPEAEVLSNVIGLLIPLEKIFSGGKTIVKGADTTLDLARGTTAGSTALNLVDDVAKKSFGSVDDIIRNTLNFGVKEVKDSPDDILSGGYNLGQIVKNNIDNLGGVGKELLGRTVTGIKTLPSLGVRALPTVTGEFLPRVGAEIGRQAVYQGIRAEQYATLLDAPSRILDKAIEKDPNNYELRVTDKILSVPKDTLIGALTAFNDNALKPSGNTLFDLGKGEQSIGKAFLQQLAIGINPELAVRSQQATNELNSLNQLKNQIEGYKGDKNSEEFKNMQSSFVSGEKTFSEGAINNIAKSTGSEFLDMAIQSAVPMAMQYLVSAGLQGTGNQLIRNGVGGQAGSLVLAKAVSVTDAPRIGGIVYASQAYNQAKDENKTDTEKLNFVLQYAGMEIAGDRIGDAIFAGTNKKVYEKLITEIPLGQRVTDSLLDFIKKGGSESGIPTLLWKKAIMEKGLAKATSEGLKNDVIKEYVVANIGKKFISEGISEAGQQVLEDQDKPLTEIVKNAGYAGLVGGTLGLFMGGFVNGSAKMLDYSAAVAGERVGGGNFENFKDRYNLNNVNKFIESGINPYLPKDMQIQAVGFNLIANKTKDGSLKIIDQETFANVFDFNQKPNLEDTEISPVLSGTVQDKKNIYSYALIRKDLANYNVAEVKDNYRDNIIIAGNGLENTPGVFDPVAKKFYPLNNQNQNPENKSVLASTVEEKKFVLVNPTQQAVFKNGRKEVQLFLTGSTEQNYQEAIDPFTAEPITDQKELVLPLLLERSIIGNIYEGNNIDEIVNSAIDTLKNVDTNQDTIDSEATQLALLKDTLKQNGISNKDIKEYLTKELNFAQDRVNGRVGLTNTEPTILDELFIPEKKVKKVVKEENRQTGLSFEQGFASELQPKKEKLGKSFNQMATEKGITPDFNSQENITGELLEPAQKKQSISKASALPLAATGVAGQLREQYGGNPLEQIANNFSDALGQLSTVMYSDNNLLAYASTIGVNNIVPLVIFTATTKLWTNLVPRSGIFNVGGRGINVLDPKSYIRKFLMSVEKSKNEITKFDKSILDDYELVNNIRANTPMVDKAYNLIDSFQDKMSGIAALKPKGQDKIDKAIDEVSKLLKDNYTNLKTKDGQEIGLDLIFAGLGISNGKWAFEGESINTFGETGQLQDLVKNPAYDVKQLVYNNENGYAVTLSVPKENGDIQTLKFKPGELTPEILSELGYNIKEDSTDKIDATLISTNPMKAFLDEESYKKAEDFVAKMNNIENVAEINIANRLGTKLNKYVQNKDGIKARAIIRQKQYLISLDDFNNDESVLQTDDKENIELQNEKQIGAGQTVLDKIKDYYKNTNENQRQGNALDGGFRRILQSPLNRVYYNVSNYFDVLGLSKTKVYSTKSEIPKSQDYTPITAEVPIKLSKDLDKSLEFILSPYTESNISGKKIEKTIYVPTELFSQIPALAPYQMGLTKNITAVSNTLNNNSIAVIAKGVVANSLANKFLTTTSFTARVLGEPIKAISTLNKNLFLRMRSSIGTDFRRNNKDGEVIADILNQRISNLIVEGKNTKAKKTSTFKENSPFNDIKIFKQVGDMADWLANNFYVANRTGNKTFVEKGNILRQSAAKFGNLAASTNRIANKVLVPQFFGRIANDVVSNLPTVGGGYTKFTDPMVAGYVMWSQQNKTEPNLNNLDAYLESEEFQFDRANLLDATGFVGRSTLQNIFSSASSFNPTARANNYLFAVTRNIQNFANTLSLTPKVLSGKASYSEFNRWMLHNFLTLLSFIIIGTITKSIYNEAIKKARNNIDQLEGGTQQYQDAVSNLIQIESQQQNLSDMMGIANFGLGIFSQMTGLDSLPLVGGVTKNLEKIPEQILNERYATIRDKTVLSDIEKAKQLGIAASTYNIKNDLPVFANSVALGLQMAGILPSDKVISSGGINKEISPNFWENLTRAESDEVLQDRIDKQKKRLNDDKLNYSTKRVQTINNQIANQGNTELAREEGLKKLNNLISQVGADTVNESMQAVGIKDISEIGKNNLKREKGGSKFKATEAKTESEIKDTFQSSLSGTSKRTTSSGSSRKLGGLRPRKNRSLRIKHTRIRRIKSPKTTRRIRVKKLKN